MAVSSCYYAFNENLFASLLFLWHWHSQEHVTLQYFIRMNQNVNGFQGGSVGLIFKLCSESSYTQTIFVFGLGLAGTRSCWLAHFTHTHIHTFTLSHTLHTRDGRHSLHLLSQKLRWDSAAAKLMTTSIMEKQARLLSSKLLQGHKQVEVVLNRCVFAWREAERGRKERSGISSLPDPGECDTLGGFCM